jgi:hypothetical protein
MRWRKRTEIKVESSLTVIRRSTNQIGIWCAACSSPVQFIRVEEATLRSGVDPSTIHSLVARERLHFVVTGAGIVLICPNSLTLWISEKENNHA